MSPLSIYTHTNRHTPQVNEPLLRTMQFTRAHTRTHTRTSFFVERTFRLKTSQGGCHEGFFVTRDKQNSKVKLICKELLATSFQKARKNFPFSSFGNEFCCVSKIREILVMNLADGCYCLHLPHIQPLLPQLSSWLLMKKECILYIPYNTKHSLDYTGARNFFRPFLWFLNWKKKFIVAFL